jgi:hypothetical protein
VVRRRYDIYLTTSDSYHEAEEAKNDDAVVVDAEEEKNDDADVVDADVVFEAEEAKNDDAVVVVEAVEAMYPKEHRLLNRKQYCEYWKAKNDKAKTTHQRRCAVC